MITVFAIIDVCAVIIALILIQRLLNATQTRRTLFPPGPKELPLIGNLLDMPTEKEWLTFSKWGEIYGDLVSVAFFGQRLIILNSAKTAVDLLDKKSSIHSDRPSIPMGGELVGWKNTLVLIPYGKRFRSYRRLAHQLFGNKATMEQFLPVEERETHRFLKRVLAQPENLSQHIRKTAGAIILHISHGYDIEEENDPFVTLADRATDQFSISTAPGGFLVNHIPALRHVPSWFPGAGFQRKAKEWAEALENMVDRPYNFVKSQMAAGKAPLSLTSSLLEGRQVGAEEEFDIKWLAASLYSGGADTTVSSIHAFFKAMALFPDVQAIAQAEVDAIIGSDRLPGFSDREQLPYINALALEVIRWHTVTPTGVPHRAIENDIQDGYFIPKGSLIVANIWKMLHDPAIYNSPSEFKPERFLGSTPEPDPRTVAFGFGRRICPGRVLADASIFISCAMSLAVYDISKYSSPEGFVSEPDVEQTTGTISHPTPFQCTIKPRAEKAVALISADEHL
ncbi:cytochrome P450 [Guyanagaster necrorhizus]|uniref:Cytochrome P450 n=1 Tax=Guyanagaster necrorhizus TaxID=856835 RepID=A0A9P7W3Q8_9AGAR|nr:cytochrome P450 [Guyanagaster necrorhizus MCA 3950]KAG7451628.1 cytochrome P450 [Guyanagaster necrorhizus MCA 3950]